jgi:hypothetical protein
MKEKNRDYNLIIIKRKKNCICPGGEMRSSVVLTVDQKWESMFRIWPIYYFKIQIKNKK